MQTNKLGLTIPTQENSKSTIDLSLPAIEKWRSELQTADVGETSRNIFSMLKTMNSTRIEPTIRFQLLELLRPLSQIIYQSLKKHYFNQIQPLSEKKISILELSITLQTEILNGYKIIVEDINMSSNSSLKNSTLPNAIYRAFKHFNNILATYYQTYTEQPENMWKEMHILYKYALACKISENIITLDISVSNKKIDVITPYKHALFIASTSPYQWRQQEQEILYHYVVLWDDYISIRNLKSSDRTQCNDVFFIPINDDHGPFTIDATKTSTPDSGSVLDLSKLTTYLKNFDKQQNTPVSKNSKDPKDITIAEYSLQKLINYLTNGTNRKLERFNIIGHVSVTFGFPSTHYYINKRKIFKPESVGEESDDSMQELELNVDSVLEDTSNTEPAYKPDTALYACKLTNIHGEGAGIIFQDIRFPPIQPGEIIAIAITMGETFDQDETHWNIGTIRWLKHNQQNKLLAGIEILAPFAMAAAVQLLKDGNGVGYFQRAFLFQNNDHNKITYNLIAPIVHFETDKHVKIYSFFHKKFVETKLKEQLSVNNNFKCFAIDIHLPTNSTTSKSNTNTNKDPSNKDPLSTSIWKEL